MLTGVVFFTSKEPKKWRRKHIINVLPKDKTVRNMFVQSRARAFEVPIFAQNNILRLCLMQITDT